MDSRANLSLTINLSIQKQQQQQPYCNANMKLLINTLALFCLLLCPLAVEGGGRGNNGDRPKKDKKKMMMKEKKTPIQKNKPQRIRREWRTIPEQMRQKYANAMWIMKLTTTQDGRKKYGPLFWNIDDMTLLHAYSTTDPRCDQGHYGPQFMTFHRAYLLRFENSMLSVDPSLEGLPYWDYARDTEQGDCFEADCYIFSDKFFGNVQGDPAENYAVTNGLFAYWPIAEWTSERFGADSDLQTVCTNQEYFVGVTASVCERCCGIESCECDQPDDVFKQWFRFHDDCTPYLARNPEEVKELFNTTNLQGTTMDFEACTLADNIHSWMEWQDCIEFEQLQCLLSLGTDCATIKQTLEDSAPQEAAGAMIRALVSAIDCERDDCTLEGFYIDSDGVKHRPQALHSQTHIRLGRDIFDVTTSPNDVGVFTGYHANIDRSNMAWMINTYDRLSENNWGYPENSNDWGARNLERVSGPFSSYDAFACSNTTVFPEYAGLDPSQPWLPGTLSDDTANSAFFFDDLWDLPPKNGEGYTHAEIIYHSDPSRTIYTYDTLAHHYGIE